MSRGTDRLITIGDVHGCVHALDALLAAIEPTRSDQLVFLGDLIDQGRDSAAVLDRLIELGGHCQIVLIQGNHEEMLLAACESEPALRYWENCGGVATLNSYKFGGKLADIPPRHWQLLAEQVPYFETETCVFTHANYLSDVPFSEQPEHQLRWALFEPADMHPHCSGKRVIVGHTEQRSGEILDLGFATCIDTACWRHGWLTALAPQSGECWQASRWGVMREADEPALRGRMPHFERSAEST